MAFETILPVQEVEEEAAGKISLLIRFKGILISEEWLAVILTEKEEY